MCCEVEMLWLLLFAAGSGHELAVQSTEKNPDPSGCAASLMCLNPNF